MVSNIFKLSVKALSPSSLINNPVICDHSLIENGVIYSILVLLVYTWYMGLICNDVEQIKMAALAGDFNFFEYRHL